MRQRRWSCIFRRGWAQGAPDGVFALTGKLPWQRCSRHATCWRRRWTRTMTSPRTSPAWRSAVRPCWRAGALWSALPAGQCAGGLMWAAACGSWSPPGYCRCHAHPFLPQPQESVDDDGWPATSEGLGRAWIFTSATLGHDAELSWFCENAAGLEGARILQRPSHLTTPRRPLCIA